MELDTNNTTRGSTDIDDEKRLSAATKRVTLAPLHEDVHPELKPDGSSEGEYGLDAPVANVPSDMENTSLVAKAPSTVPDEIVVPPSTSPSVRTTPLQSPAPTTAAVTAPSADFLPTAPAVTKKRKTVPIIIAVTGVVAVIAAGLIAYGIISR